MQSSNHPLLAERDSKCKSQPMNVTSLRVHELTHQHILKRSRDRHCGARADWNLTRMGQGSLEPESNQKPVVLRVLAWGHQRFRTAVYPVWIQNAVPERRSDGLCRRSTGFDCVLFLL